MTVTPVWKSRQEGGIYGAVLLVADHQEGDLGIRAGFKLILLCLSVALFMCLSGCTNDGLYMFIDGSASSAEPSGNPAHLDNDAVSESLRDAAPEVLPIEAPGVKTLANDKAILDYSKTDLGYICAKSLVAPTVKVLVEAAGTRYQYSLRNDNEYVAIPMSEGDGSYAVSFWENLYDDNYAAIFSQDLEVSISDPFLPFLHPNQYVNFNMSDNAVAFSQVLTKDSADTVSAIADIYSYVIENIQYDYEKAATVPQGYLPVIDETLETKKGICFDYSVLMASMLRAQRIPSKLVIGYAGSAYHAWIEVYSSEEGWIKKEIYFNGEDYTLMDPTFASVGGGRANISSIIGDGSNYNPRFYY